MVADFTYNRRKLIFFKRMLMPFHYACLSPKFFFFFLLRGLRLLFSICEVQEGIFEDIAVRNHNALRDVTVYREEIKIT